MSDQVYAGNAGLDAAGDAGRLLGHFKPPGDPRFSEDAEIKWGVHAAGDERDQWVRGEVRTAEESVVLTVRRPSVPGYRVGGGE
ncbi:hypothetical protein HII36_21710 [Nonomuraea sp. NN258]|uniref:hypothetical protein n=1 Tax=Nonomuraea antri TaxID=2730852 RepID=UPI0015697C8A|nr:hypothetical protein [Nonomuraea antri]NRQ34450.1 hypothetical protein [Nonomuraea antri]